MISAAFAAAVELALVVHGKGPHQKILACGDPVDGFGFRMNTTLEALDGVQPGTMNVSYNGWPVGSLTLYDGVFIASGETGNTERDFIAWCQQQTEAKARELN